MFTEALRGHIHVTPLPCSDTANVDPPLPSSAAANVNPLLLVGGFPSAGGGSPVDSQPPPPLLPPPFDDTNVDPSSITDALPGAAGVSSVDIQPPPSSPPRKLMFTVTLPAGEFDFDFDSDSHSSEDRFHSYIPPVPRGDALRVFLRLNDMYGCPVCPNLMHRWCKLNQVKDHVLGMAKSAPLRQNYKKKWSHHCIVARNEGWMEYME
jgi:hypothetical protein